MLRKVIKYWNWKRIYSNLAYFFKNDFYAKETEIIFKCKDEAVEDCAYELKEDMELLPNLDILNDVNTINKLINEPKSFARFGDGEIAIIQGKDCGFQKYDPILANKLLKLLNTPRNDVYVGLNRSYFHTPFIYSENNHRFYRIHGTEYRRFFLKHCAPDNVYLDACCFGGYYRLNDSTDFDAVYKRNKEVFRNKKIAIVGGNGILKQLQFDVFELSFERIIIEAPSINAFDEYEKIIAEIEEKVPHDYIVCLILGQTATVMAADLTDKGYIAWDIGHLPKDYDAYMMKIDKTPDNIRKHWDVDK